MAGIPSDLLIDLQETLADCDQFESNRSLRRLFAHEEIHLWRNNLPEEDAPKKRVDAVIYYLHNKRRVDGANGLILLLKILRDQIDPGDGRHQALSRLVTELAAALAQPDEGVKKTGSPAHGAVSAPARRSAAAKEISDEKKDFFISYNHLDKQWAEWIAWQLEEVGYTTIVQAWDFRPGGNFVADMHRAASSTERTIAVLSPTYLESGFTQSEWSAAFAQDPTGERGLLLPIRVRDCATSGLLSQIAYIDLVGLGREAAREALLNGVKRGRLKPTSPPQFPGGTGDKPQFPGRQ